MNTLETIGRWMEKHPVTSWFLGILYHVIFFILAIATDNGRANGQGTTSIVYMCILLTPIALAALFIIGCLLTIFVMELAKEWGGKREVD